MMVHGADAYPFTEERVRSWRRRRKRKEEVAGEGEASSPRGARARSGQAQGVHVRRLRRGGSGWSFYCKECDFDCIQVCSAEEEAEAAGDGGTKEEERRKEREGWLRGDGEVCYKRNLCKMLWILLYYLCAKLELVCGCDEE
ncbi:putative nucleoredoxin 1 [Iris pallida]|uniref:Nucleoredoxin 1 n=1 Tax=Iris pallida TaxID=29817 RepID=A0AAX6GJZ9_IRIPA|nr:putative nucleoredoxin 1 [Iris pallida]